MPSEAGQEIRFLPEIFPAVLFFAWSQSLAVYRDRRLWWISLLKLFLFVVFGWYVVERVRMGAY